MYHWGIKTEKEEFFFLPLEALENIKDPLHSGKCSAYCYFIWCEAVFQVYLLKRGNFIYTYKSEFQTLWAWFCDITSNLVANHGQMYNFHKSPVYIENRLNEACSILQVNDTFVRFQILDISLR